MASGNGLIRILLCRCKPQKDALLMMMLLGVNLSCNRNLNGLIPVLVQALVLEGSVTVCRWLQSINRPCLGLPALHLLSLEQEQEE